MTDLITAIVTLVIVIPLSAIEIYIICKIVSPFIINIIHEAKTKPEKNPITIEAIKGRIQYYERMIEVTQSDELIEEYNEKIMQLTEELNK